MNQIKIGSNTSTYNTTLLCVFSPNSILPLFGVPYFLKKKKTSEYILWKIFFYYKMYSILTLIL